MPAGAQKMLRHQRHYAVSVAGAGGRKASGVIFLHCYKAPYLRRRICDASSETLFLHELQRGRDDRLCPIGRPRQIAGPLGGQLSLAALAGCYNGDSAEFGGTGVECGTHALSCLRRLHETQQLVLRPAMGTLGGPTG